MEQKGSRKKTLQNNQYCGKQFFTKKEKRYETPCDVPCITTNDNKYLYEADDFAGFLYFDRERLPNPKRCAEYQIIFLVLMENAVNLYAFIKSIEEVNKTEYIIDWSLTHGLNSNDVNVVGYHYYTNFTKKYEENKKKKTNAMAVAYIELSKSKKNSNRKKLVCYMV